MSNSVVISSREQNWLGLEVMQAHLGFNEMSVPPLGSHTVVINLGQPFDIRAKVDGRKRKGVMAQNHLKIIPAYLPSDWQWKEGVALNVLHLSLNHSFMRDIMLETNLNPDRIEMVERLGVVDTQLEQLGRSLLGELRSKGLAGPLYVDALTNMLAVHLLRHHSSVEQPRAIQEYNGPLAQLELRRLLDYINTNLTSSLRLSELANLVNLSPYYFARQFKQSMGISPHQYIIQCRVQKAKLLLATTKLSLPQIAQAVGFTDQSHMARHFRQLLGVSPTYLRKG